jgi:cellobiose-specific phosphotransferase system component IIA
MKMDGVRMALAIGEILHHLNSSLINKEAEKKGNMMKCVLIHAKSRNLRHVDATDDRCFKSSVTIV